MRKFIFAVLISALVITLLKLTPVTATQLSVSPTPVSRQFLPLIMSSLPIFNPFPDGEFPGTPVTIKGPKIVEAWSAPWNQCRIFKLDDGASFNWQFNGHIFSFASQSELDERYPEHRDSFLAKPGNESCLEGLPEAPILPTATPTTEVTQTPQPTLPIATATPTVTEEPTQTPTVTATALPLEGTFPGTAYGYTIIEWFDGASACGIFTSDSDFDYDRLGHWWGFTDPTSRDEAYPAHLAAYFDKPENADCIEGQP